MFATRKKVAEDHVGFSFKSIFKHSCMKATKKVLTEHIRNIFSIT